jgi:hypothetical protein
MYNFVTDMAKYVVFDAELFSICVSSAKLSGK